MTTWAWQCTVDGCDTVPNSGTGPDYDTVIAAAQDHNAAAEHVQPSISYSNDEPPVVTPEPQPVSEQAAGQVANTISDALSALDPTTATPADIISAINNSLAPYLSPA